MDLDKRLQDLTEKLIYITDIFAGKHSEDIGLLTARLYELKQSIASGSIAHPGEGVETLEDLFIFMEDKLEDRLTPMDRARIVRHQQRVCLLDILENVYDSYTEIGGQDEYTNDPAIRIARATINRSRGKTKYQQSVLVVGHEKGHGEEYRNGGAAKPWGNAKVENYLEVAETEGIPVHAYVFTPGGDPVEDYPGAAQQIARNLYKMAGLEVPMVAIFSEGGSGGAEALALADKRLMLSHGYYSVISPEGAAAIEGRIKTEQRASADLVEECASNLRLTALDNLEFGYINRIIQEPKLGARMKDQAFFRRLRREVLLATDEIILELRSFSPMRGSALRHLRARDSDPDQAYIRWDLSKSERKKLVDKRQNIYLRYSKDAYLNRQSIMGKLTDAWSEQWWEIYNRLIYDFYHRNRRYFSTWLDEMGSEWIALKHRLGAPFRKIRNSLRNEEDTTGLSQALTSLSDWDSTKEVGGWLWVSPKAGSDRAITCPNAATHGCLDLWAPDLYNEFAGVCSTCGHHFPMEYQWMLYNCFDADSLFEFNSEFVSCNPINFPGLNDKLDEARKQTELKCACLTFEARIEGTQTIVALLPGSFRGGSFGAAEGAKFVAAAERARRKRYPFIVYCHGTAGIRIQEGTHGLIQMPRCTVAVQRYIEAGGLYIVIYDTNSYGGPVASFLGCASYQFAIRSSNIGFAGPGVIKTTTGRIVPPNYHNCYQALSRGHIQGVWDRRDARTNIKRALNTMGGRNLYYR